MSLNFISVPCLPESFQCNPLDYLEPKDSVAILKDNTQNRQDTPAEAKIIRDKNVRAWVSMVLYLKNLKIFVIWGLPGKKHSQFCLIWIEIGRIGRQIPNGFLFLDFFYSLDMKLLRTMPSNFHLILLNVATVLVRRLFSFLGSGFFYRNTLFFTYER